MYLYSRRQSAEFHIFTSKFEIFILMRLKAAWMDLMPAHTAKRLTQEELPRTSKPLACRQTIQKYSGSTLQVCRQGTNPK